MYPDPLAGLLTGEHIAGSTLFESYGDDVRSAIAEPVVDVDDHAIKAMVDAAMAEETGEYIPAPRTAPRPPTSRTGQFGQRGAPAPPGMLAPPQHRPPAALVRQALRAYPRSGQRSGQPQLARPQRKPTAAGGIIVAIIVIVVFLAIAIQVVAGILGTFMD